MAELHSGPHRVENIGALGRDVDVSNGDRLASDRFARRGEILVAARQPAARPAVVLNSKPRSVPLPDIAAEATCAMDAITAAFPIARISRSPDMRRPEALTRLYRKAAKRRVPVNPTLESNAAMKLDARTVPSPAPKVAVSTNAINASVFQAVRSSPDCD
jgi:hypothetical protein